MPIIEVTSIKDKSLEIYSALTEHQLKRKENGKGLFIAESPKVIRCALQYGYEPVSLLCESKHILGDAADIIASCPGMTVFTGSREILSELTGYKLTRGVLCAMKRKPLMDPDEICLRGHYIAVIDGVCDTTNIGSIFRSASALGINGILLTSNSCDPLNRRSVRVSMGTVFSVPWTFCDNPASLLKNHGYTTVALTLHPDSIPINSSILTRCEHLALFLGTEGDGLAESVVSQCDFKAIIPMHNGVDSLNVGAAAAVAFWELVSKERDCK